jgi:hypothetical protein
MIWTVPVAIVGHVPITAGILGVAPPVGSGVLEDPELDAMPLLAPLLPWPLLPWPLVLPWPLLPALWLPEDALEPEAPGPMYWPESSPGVAAVPLEAPAPLELPLEELPASDP